MKSLIFHFCRFSPDLKQQLEIIFCRLMHQSYVATAPPHPQPPTVNSEDNNFSSITALLKDFHCGAGWGRGGGGRGGQDLLSHSPALLVGWLCWGLTSQSTIFQSYRDGAIASWVINQYFWGVKCLAQGHNTAAVGLEPRTSRSGVRHSTTEPPPSPPCSV